MQSFRHIFPPLRIFHGEDSLKQLGRELERVGSCRAVIFCGSSLAREASVLEMVRSEAGERCAGVYTGVAAHSPLPDAAPASCWRSRATPGRCAPAATPAASCAARNCWHPRAELATVSMEDWFVRDNPRRHLRHARVAP